MYRSKLIAAIVNKDAQVSVVPAVPNIAYRGQMIPEEPFTLAMRKEANIGCAAIPTPRSVRTRLPSKSFDGKCKDVFFRIADKTKMFATVVTRASRTFKEAFTI